MNTMKSTKFFYEVSQILIRWKIQYEGTKQNKNGSRKLWNVSFTNVLEIFDGLHQVAFVKNTKIAFENEIVLSQQFYIIKLIKNFLT